MKDIRYSWRSALWETGGKCLNTLGKSCAVATAVIPLMQYKVRGVLGKWGGTDLPYRVDASLNGSAEVDVALRSDNPIINGFLPKKIEHDFPIQDHQTEHGALFTIPGPETVKGPYAVQIAMAVFAAPLYYAGGMAEQFGKSFRHVGEKSIKGVRTKASDICRFLSDACHLTGDALGIAIPIVIAVDEAAQGALSGIPVHDSIKHKFPVHMKETGNYVYHEGGYNIYANVTGSANANACVNVHANFTSIQDIAEDLGTSKLVLIALGGGVLLAHFMGNALSQIEDSIKLKEVRRPEIDRLRGSANRSARADSGDAYIRLPEDEDKDGGSNPSTRVQRSDSSSSARQRGMRRSSSTPDFRRTREYELEEVVER